MKNKSFYLRLISIGVILAALLTYNSITQTRLEAAEAVQAAGQATGQAAGQAAARQTGSNDAAGTGAGSGNNAGTGNGGAANSGTDATGTDATGTNATGSNSASPGASGVNAAGSAGFKDGTYQGEAQGYGGPVTVSVTISGGRITNVTVLSHDMEDEAYYNMAAPLADKVVEAQSTAIDTVSGATFSSNGILGAVEDALKEAT